MYFKNAIILVLAAVVAAAPAEDASPVEHVAARAGEAAASFTAVGNCKPGKYYCANAVSSGGGCSSCAIAVGNSAGKCQLNNFCGDSNGSCEVINGQPYCH